MYVERMRTVCMFAVDLTNGQLTPNNNTPLLAQALSGEDALPSYLLLSLIMSVSYPHTPILREQPTLITPNNLVHGLNSMSLDVLYVINIICVELYEIY